MSAEAKVGLLVIFFALLAISTGLYLTDALGRLGALQVTIQFEDVQGLEPGAQVRLGGVFIGRVTEVALSPHAKYPDKSAAVRVQIQRGVMLYNTDTFEIKQGAVVGDKYLAVRRAPRQKSRERLVSGDVVEGAGASSAEVIMDETRALVAAARATVDTIRAIAGDQATQQNLRDILTNVNQATARAVIVSEQAIELTASLNRSGRLGEARIGEMMDHLTGAAGTVETMANRVDRMLEVSPIPAQLTLAGENIRQASEDVAALVAHARSTVEDEQVQTQLTATVANLKEASENVRSATANLAALSADEQLLTDVRETLANVREASDSLRNAAEAAEGLITDEQTQEDLRATVSGFRRVSETSAETLQRADGIMSDIERTMGSVRRTQGMISDIEARPMLQMRATTGGGLRADAVVDLRLTPTSRDHWRLGMRDVGDTERFDLLWGHSIGADVLRAGLIGSQLGVGYERSVGAHTAIEAELYDPDNLRLDMGMRWGLWKSYYLLLGVQRVAAGTDPYLGVRYQQPF